MGMRTKSSNPISLPAEGTVPARLVKVVEIGEQETGYGVKPLVFLHYNLVTRFIEDEGDYQGKQYQVRSQPLNNSANEAANLYDHRLALGKTDTVDYNELLGLPAMVTIKHNDVESGGQKKTYANIINVSPIPEGYDVPEADVDLEYFNFDDPDSEIWESLGDWYQGKIKEAKDYPGSKVEEMVLHLEAMNS
jgi:hypothetical protein